MGPSMSAMKATCFTGFGPVRAQNLGLSQPQAGRPASTSRATAGHSRLREAALSLSAAAATRLAARRCSGQHWRLRRALRRADADLDDGEYIAGTSIYDDDGEWLPGMGALDMLPNMSREPEEEKKRKEPTEPAMVLDVRGDLLVVRAGKGLFTQDQPGQIACTDSGADAVLLAWKEDIAILQLLAGEAEPADEVRRLEEKFLMTKCSPELRGRILDPEGRPLDGLPMPRVLEPRRIFMKEKPKEARSNQYRPFFTGVQGIDFDVPIGRGQTMLFQGSDPEKDRKLLWPDLMQTQPVVGGCDGDPVNVAVCRDLDEARELRSKLEAVGCWERCTIFVPISDDPASRMIATNAAIAFAEYFGQEGEAMVLCDFEALHDVWNVLAEIAGQERSARGLLVDPKEEQWIQMQGTVIRESIGERRKFWFRLVNRAVNEVDKGSVTLLGWLWEQDGSYLYRKRQAYEMKLEQIAKIQRISDEVRQKLVDKVKADAADEGISFETEKDDGALKPNPSIPGVPNWEIEELKSITDGHIILQSPTDPDAWEWRVDGYRSLPRLGTDALHAALISADSPKLRLKMMQGKDRADLLHDSIGASKTLDDKPGVELQFIELLLHQRAGELFTVEEEVARIAIAADPECSRLRAVQGELPRRKELTTMAKELLETSAGKKACADISSLGWVAPDTLEALNAEVASFR